MTNAWIGKLIMAATAWHRLRNAPWRRLCLLAPLIATGCVLYLVLPPAPRWRLPGSFRIHDFVQDGRVAVVTTQVKSSGVEAGQPAPLAERTAERTFAWIDVDTGRTLRSLDVVSSYYMFSPDCSVLAYGRDGQFGFIRVSDGRQSIAKASYDYLQWPAQMMLFSECGRWLARWRHRPPGRTAGESRIDLFDTTTAAVQKTWHNVGNGWCFAGGHVVVPVEENKRWRLIVWDPAKSQEAAFGPYTTVHGCSLPRPVARSDIFIVRPSSRGRYALASANDRLDVIDLQTLKVMLTIPEKRPPSAFVFSDDEQRLALWRDVPKEPAWRIETWDVPARSRLANTTIHGDLNRGIFSPNGDLLFLSHVRNLFSSKKIFGPQPHAMLRVADGKLLWSGETQHRRAEPLFHQGSAVLGVDDGARGFQLFDAATGALRDTFRPYEDGDGKWLRVESGGTHYPWVSADKRCVVFGRIRIEKSLWLPLLGKVLQCSAKDSVAILDLDERDVHRIHLPKIDSYRLTEHGPALLICHEADGQRMLTAWDIPPRRPWVAIIGWPLILGVLLFGFGHWRRGPSSRGRGVLAKSG